MATQLPKLQVIDTSNPPSFTTPIKRINETQDVSSFLTSLAYRDIGLFLMQLNRSVCPRKKPDSAVPIMFRSSSKISLSSSTQTLQSFLSTFEALIEDAPPAPGTQRFGNVSFRTWYQLLEQKLETLLSEGPIAKLLSVGNGDAKAEVKSYLLGAFGSAQRLDYGTGHELSFVAFLGCLWKLDYFKSDAADGQVEREIVLGVIDPYLALVRKLIMTYRLEPAGTHGVWGLDDHSFVPYIFGSSQLTRPIDENEPMPLEGSVRGAPKPTAITNAQTVEDERQTNMYFAAIGFINDIKKGPFWEHSPTLFDISGVKDGWGKINKGMIKMYNAEVLSKFPVVQHFYFGALFSWEQDPNAAITAEATTSARPHVTSMPPPPATTTGAPWAPTPRMPAPGAGTAAPWAQSERLPSASAVPQRPGGNQTSTHGDNVPTKAPWAK